MSVRRILITTAGLLALGHPVTANAAAWTQPQGEAQLILTGVTSHSDKGFDTHGKVVDIADYDKHELYLLAEYGVTDDLTLTATPSLSRVDVGDGRRHGAGDSSGLGYTEFGARYRLGSGRRWVASVQATARLPGVRRRSNLAQVGSTGAEYDIRALAGVTFTLAGAPAFLDVQGSYRLRAAAPPDEFHADATLGVTLTPRLQLLAQSFNTLSNGAGRGVFNAYRYHNAYVSAVYALSDHWSAQVGGLGTIAGKSALRERGLTGALWYRF